MPKSPDGETPCAAFDRPSKPQLRRRTLLVTGFANLAYLVSEDVLQLVQAYDINPSSLLPDNKTHPLTGRGRPLLAVFDPATLRLTAIFKLN